MSAVGGIGPVGGGNLPPIIGPGTAGAAPAAPATFGSKGLVQGPHSTNQVAGLLGGSSLQVGSAMQTSLVTRVDQAIGAGNGSPLADVVRTAIALWALGKLLGNDEEDEKGQKFAAMAMLMLLATSPASMTFSTLTQSAVMPADQAGAYNAAGQTGSGMPQTGMMLDVTA